MPDLLWEGIQGDYNVLTFSGNAGGNKIMEVDDDHKNIIIWDTDSCWPISIFKKTRVFRTSMLRSKRQSNEFILPASLRYSFSSEFRHDNHTPLENIYTEMPSVGFCGWNCNFPRKRTIRTFKQCERIKSDIKVRDRFVKHFPREARDLLQKEY